MSLDRATVKKIRELMQTALDDLDVEEEIGQKIKFSVGNASFSGNSVTFKVEGATMGEDGQVNNKAADDFRRYANLWGLSPDDLGREISVNGKTMTIVGGKPRSKKYPILAENMGNGKIYKLSAWTVKAAL